MVGGKDPFASLLCIHARLRQGLEKAFKAQKYNVDYSEDHSHELYRLIPNIVGLRDMAVPLVV